MSTLDTVEYSYLPTDKSWDTDTWSISDGSETIPLTAIDGNRHTIYRSPSDDPFPYVEIRLPYPALVFRFGMRSEYPFGTPDENEVEDYLQASNLAQLTLLIM